MTREELLKIAKPILFNTEMVQAILEGRKTVTRRIIKPQPVLEGGFWKLGGAGWSNNIKTVYPIPCHSLYNKAPYKPGDILYTRETWREQPVGEDGHIEIEYKADFNEGELACYGRRGGWAPRNWEPSIHMPKELARIFLKVTDVRVERLQDIDNRECYNNFAREGISTDDLPWGETKYSIHMRTDFINLWNSTVKNLDQYGWDANPWVWVIDFERVEEE